MGSLIILSHSRSAAFSSYSQLSPRTSARVGAPSSPPHGKAELEKFLARSCTQPIFSLPHMRDSPTCAASLYLSILCACVCLFSCSHESPRAACKHGRAWLAHAHGQRRTGMLCALGGGGTGMHAREHSPGACVHMCVHVCLCENLVCAESILSCVHVRLTVSCFSSGLHGCESRGAHRLHGLHAPRAAHTQLLRTRHSQAGRRAGAQRADTRTRHS